MTDKHEKLSQKYSTWGDKLLQHAEVLSSIQNEKTFKPITIQLSVCELCTSSCPFCSISLRPLKSYLSFPKIEKLLKDFKYLGAKSLELTGGGQCDLYYDKDHKKNINDVIEVANSLGYDIGIITNANDLCRIKKENYTKINWIRISLIKLEENCSPEDYNFRDFPAEKLGFSYICYDDTEPSKNAFNNKYQYKPTSVESIEKIARLVELHKEIKFVRIAGNCLIKNQNNETMKKYKDIVDKIDLYNKFFIKTIYDNDSAFDDGCYSGCVRPYISAHPEGGDNPYQVYICTSHVLNTRNYDLDYSLGTVDDVIGIWNRMNESYKVNGYPYQIKGNNGCGWSKSCQFCYYFNNNKLLHTVAQSMPDRNFP